MSWSSSRQLIVLSILILVVLTIGSFFAIPYIFKSPTCIDNVQNQGELGVDCGGPCTKLCSNQVNDLKVLWARPFKVTDGVYDAVAYVENQNYDAALKKVVYKFSLYDENNLLVAERVGKTYITPNGKIPIFEGGIRTGERVPKRAFFEFAEIPEWTKVLGKAISFSLGTRSINLVASSTNSSSPTLSATIFNNSIYSVNDVEVTAIIYDDKDNAIAVSRTMIDVLKKDSSENVIFTWLLPFDKTPTHIEIIPRVDIFSINF